MRQAVYREEKPVTSYKTYLQSTEAYTCDVCGKDFDREDTRNRHMKTHLMDPTASGQTYSCGVCDKS
jgi:predicted SprT family Zn-dependent metalloprotease